MLFWIFLVRCSSRSTIIFLIVSKEIQKYDQRKFYFFSEKKHFQIWYSRSSLKKNCKKNLQFFSVHQNCKTKKFAIREISNKKFRKIHYFANIKYKRNSRKYCEKNLRRNIFVKRKILAKRNSIKKLSPKKICRKNVSKEILKIILAMFLYLKKKSVNFGKKKHFENNFCNFFISEKKVG